MARSLLAEEHDLYAPDNLQIEAANALLKKVRRREISLSDARRGIHTYMRVLSLLPAIEAYERGIELAISYGCSTYDGVYVAAAEIADCPLVTADERLVRSLGPSFERRVLWLGDMPV
jgi:predicted nucleic acid-binding protein